MILENPDLTEHLLSARPYKDTQGVQTQRGSEGSGLTVWDGSGLCQFSVPLASY